MTEPDKENVPPSPGGSAIDQFVDQIQSGEIREVNKLEALRRMLSLYGADFDQPEERLKPLSEYTNKAKRPGLDAVWGKEKVDEFWEFIDEFIVNKEKVTQKELPKLGKSGSKSSGMRQFFGELTAFAAGQMSFSDFKKYTQARALNGKLWQEGRKNERVEIKVPTSKKPILLSSFPPDFPQAALGKIKSWKAEG